MATKTTKKKPVRQAQDKPVIKKTIPNSVNTESPRRVKIPKRRIYKRLDKRFRARPKLPGAFKLTGKAARLIRDHWKVIGGIMLIYGVLNILLVRGLTGGLNVSDLKSQTDSLFHGFNGHILSGFTIFGLLISSSNNVASAASSAYQTFLLIIVSLAVVWSYRQLLAGKTIRIRDGFYNGMQPLVPVILVLLVLSLQLLPLVFGVWLYSALIGGGIAATILEQILSISIVLLLISWTVYMLCSSLFALYIAALPAMTPLRALRSARELVRYRRWPLIRKLLFLPFVLLLICVAVMLPIILIVPVIAQWVFFILSTLTLAAVHAYLYTLYRELISD